MELETRHAAPEINHLRTCINDLIAVVALPLSEQVVALNAALRTR
jgi:hypothetical protein